MRTRGVILLWVALVALCMTVHATTTVVSDTMTISRGTVIDGDIYLFTAHRESTAVAFVGVSITGSGLTFSGVNPNQLPLSVAVSDSTTRAAIVFSGPMTPNADFRFSDLKADMPSAIPVLRFSNAIYQNNVTIRVIGSQATWSTGARSDFVQMLGTTRFVAVSALFIYRLEMTNGRNVLNLMLSDGAVIQNGSVLAVDNVTSVDSTGPLVRFSGSAVFEKDSLFRVTNSYSGAQPLVTHDMPISVTSGSTYRVAYSSTIGSLFSFATPLTASEGSTITFDHLKGSSTGLSASNPIPVLQSSSNSYGASIEVGGVTLDSSTYAPYGLNVLLAATECGIDRCIRGTSGGADYLDIYCQCVCNGLEFFQPACTYMRDPTAPTMTAEITCDIPQCAVCSYVRPGTCEVCNAGWEKDEATGGCKRACNDDRCAECTEDGVCLECKPGYVLDPVTKGCFTCNVPDCEYCSADDVCAKCIESKPVTLNQGRCISCNVPNCLECYEADMCLKCKDDGHTYTLTPDGQCILCDIPCYKCVAPNTCDPNECHPGYTYNNGQCYYCPIPHCIRCSADRRCEECAKDADYTLTPDQLKCYLCTDPRCKTCSSDNVCSECHDSTDTLLNGVCIQCSLDRCQTCCSTNKCCGCKYPYRPSSLSKADDLVCVTCNVENCAQCSSDDYCSQCMLSPSGVYTIQNGKCVFLPSCRNGYVYDEAGERCNRICSVGNCDVCSTWDSCSTCAAGFSRIPQPENGNRNICTCTVSECTQCYQSNCNRCSIQSTYNPTTGLCVFPLNYRYSQSPNSSMHSSVIGISSAVLIFAITVLVTALW